MEEHSKLDLKSEHRSTSGVIDLSTSSGQNNSHSSNGSFTQKKEVKTALDSAFDTIKAETDKFKTSIGQVKNEVKKTIDQVFDGKSNDTKQSKSSSSHSGDKGKSIAQTFEVKEQGSKQSKSSSDHPGKDKKKAIEQTFSAKGQDSKQSNASSSQSFTFSEEAFHVDPKSIDKVTTLDGKKVQEEKNLGGRLGNGSFFDPGGGENTVIAGSGNDIVRGDGRGFNTIAGGDGSNTFVLGKETTNRILDFDPKKDSFLLSGALKVGDIAFGQGTNPTKAGLDTPLDGAANAVIFDKNGGNHILASLPFVNASDLSEKNFGTVSKDQLNKAAQSA